MNQKIQTVLNRSLYAIAILVCCTLFILNLLYTTTVSYDGYENVSIHATIGKSVLILGIAAAVFCILIIVKDSLIKLSEKKLFLILSVIYSIMATYLILNVEHEIRADAFSVASVAGQLLEGDISSFQEGYLNTYPHQIGLALYDAFLYLFSKNTAIHFLTNFLLVLGTNYVIYKITDVLFQNHMANLFAIILSFAFLPQFFFILFAYGNIPGFFFLSLAFYFTLTFTTSRRPLDMVALVICAILAVLIRKNCAIGVIAMILYLLLDLLKKYTHKHLILIVLLALAIVLPAKLLTSYYMNKADIPAAGQPTVMWVAMGTNIDNTGRGPGWYDNAYGDLYQNAGRDPEVTHEIGMTILKANLQKIKQEPGRAISFFHQKTISQWCDPMFQSVWSGPLVHCDQQTYTPLLQSIYSGGNAESIIAFECKTVVIFVLGLAVLFLLKMPQNHSAWELFFMFLIGGFLFHLLWEAKSQYIYQYLLSLLPFSAFALSSMVTKSSAVSKK